FPALRVYGGVCDGLESAQRGDLSMPVRRRQFGAQREVTKTKFFCANSLTLPTRGVIGLRRQKHVECAAILLDHDEGLSAAAMEVALYSMAARNFLRQGRG